MPKFEKQYVHFMWDDELKGKYVFYANSIAILIDSIRFTSSYTREGVVAYSGDTKFPFSVNDNDWRFVYYDPYYDLKVAYEQGQTLQIQTDENTWEDIEGEFDFTIEPQYLRVRPIPSRITCRELSRWLAQGNGEYRAYNDNLLPDVRRTEYLYEQDTEPVGAVKIRKWEDEEWHEPTREYIGLD